MADETAPPIAPFVDDSSVREVYAETVQVLIGVPGVLRFELCVNRWTQQQPVHVDRVIPVARFAMGIATARALRDHIQLALDLVEKQSQMAQMPAVSTAKN